MRKNLREILTTLDFYCALILSVAVLAYRVFGPALPPEAFMAMTVLVVGAMSSYAQCLFGLDGEGGLSRYRLLPVRGWQLLLAKDAAFLAVVIPLTLPLAVLPGIGAALVALAVGHAPAVEHPRPQTRWRFSTGGALGNGAIQLMALAMTASGIFSDQRVVSGRRRWRRGRSRCGGTDATWSACWGDRRGTLWVRLPLEFLHFAGNFHGHQPRRGARK